LIRTRQQSRLHYALIMFSLGSADITGYQRTCFADDTNTAAAAAAAGVCPSSAPAAQLQLESVDITGCRNLGAFSSSSPCLTTLDASACSRLHSLTLASRSMRLLQLANCGQLSEVYVAAAAPPPPPPRSAAAADDGAQGSRKTTGRASDGTSSRAAGKRVVAIGSGRGLVLSGCTSLSPDARARLAAAVLG
jgi:hypothetical protein